MEWIRAAAPSILAWNYLVFSVLLGWNHWRVRAARRARGIPEEQPSIRDPRSMQGLALEGLSFVVAAVFRRAEAAPGWLAAVSIVFGFAAVGMLFWALRHLGLEWRIKAVVTENHRLVTTGPYGVVRHPVFAALTALLVATVAVKTAPWAAFVAMAICVYGTGIRVKAEDGLLARRFGERFEEYKAAVPAYVPFVK